MKKLVTGLYFILTITWSLNYVMCKHGINDVKKFRQIDDVFDVHAAGAMRCDAHHPVERIRDFMRSH